jgi:hypothetical protein
MQEMNKRLFYNVLAIAIVSFIFDNQTINSQTVDNLFISYNRLDSSNQGSLAIEFDNMTFFKNNEYNTTFQKGYTLPGFWIQVKMDYQPLSNLKIEAGIHSLWFWGTNRYPDYAYKNLPQWNGEENSNTVHLLPYFRAHLSLSKNFDFVMGNIYGASNHRLIEPLYNPELNLTSDPETGTQLLFNSKLFDGDLWVNWQSFIYDLDNHKEAFVSGLSSKFKINDKNSKIHAYIPIQALIQHRGGEIDTLSGDVETMINYALGVGVKWNLNNKVLKNIEFQSYMVYHNFPKCHTVSIKKGHGFYSKLSAQLGNFNISADYWNSHNFVPLYGNPFYGSVSTKYEGVYYDDPSMLHFRADYVHSLGKGFDFGIYTELFYFTSGKMYSYVTKIVEEKPFGKNLNSSLGIYLRLNPSFLIKRF